ncbi:4-hydroxythreonine-4-phosphate dehydrogenase [Helicobacter himalayensis]|uniref:4-hydroxythreonine-4-phosphate dehydrogenase n=1 Tax=Helicobacter himalayensis TaxID=1591088 RepID=UPI003D6FA46A
MKTIAISIGDINGISAQIALSAHKEISRFCKPIYCVHKELLAQAQKKLKNPLSLQDFSFNPPKGIESLPQIKPGEVDSQSGAYSFASFLCACDLVDSKEACALVSLPIHKESWASAQIPFIGHTQALSARYKKEAIMMLGCEQMFVALFSDHIALRAVSEHISLEPLTNFLLTFAKCVNLNEPCAVLGLNPHCGDNGLMGDEDKIIFQAVKNANKMLKNELFVGALPPDSAFSPHNRKKFRYFVSMYHDVGLAPLKALYFDESINVSLNLPILRASVDHGVAFDKAYKNLPLDTKSYINALRYASEKG